MPERKFKERLRSCYWWHNNSFYDLNEIISSAELVDDETLCVSLNDNTILYGPRVMDLPSIKYGNPRRLDKIKDFEHFGTFLHQLYERYVEGMYE